MNSRPANIGRSEGSVRFSKKLAAVLVTGVVSLVLVIGATSVWISRQHDDLARDSAERMVRGGFAALEGRLDTTIRDYSLWTEAYEQIRAHDLAWIYPNIGSGATESGAADLIMVIEPGATANYGWTAESGEEPAADLLPDEVVQAALPLLDGVAADEVIPVHFYTRVEGVLWLLAVSRVMPWEGVPDGVTDAGIPRLLFGLRISDEVAEGIGLTFLIDDVRVAAAPGAGQSSLPLLDAAGAPAGYVTWVMPRPGARILRNIAVPLGFVLALIAIVAALASRHVVSSAQRLEAALAADRSKSEFLANISHDLRTPMNGIIGIGQLLRQTALDEKQDKMLGTLLSSAVAQMTLIDNLLDFGRIEAGVRSLDCAPFEPASTVRETLEILLPEATRKGIELREDLAAAERTNVLGDREAFRRIVTNLAGNAVKFTRKGHVAISLTAEREDGKARLTLRVEDTGPGVPPELQAHIFKRYGRAESGPVPVGGIGLGLAITQSLAELMGGEITLRSAPGQGATFTVTMRFDWREQADGTREAA